MQSFEMLDLILLIYRYYRLQILFYCTLFTIKHYQIMSIALFGGSYYF